MAMKFRVEMQFLVATREKTAPIKKSVGSVFTQVRRNTETIEKMQTFLPYPDFVKSLECLDYKRLGKQRVEAGQILDALTIKKSSHWKYHPAVKMWNGYFDALASYHDCAIRIWIARGYNNTMGFRSYPASKVTMPEWIGNSEFHLSHQSNLVRKDAVHYRKYFPHVPDNLPYVWPIK